MSKIITSSKNKNYFINVDISPDHKNEAYSAIVNYINRVNKDKINRPLYATYKNFNDSNYKESWVICLPNIVLDKCKNNKIVFKKNFILEEYAPGINMMLISNENK